MTNAMVDGALFPCLFLFSIDCVYQLAPTLRCIVTKHFVFLAVIESRDLVSSSGVTRGLSQNGKT